ncbi:S9 family peptidase [Gloeobacter kilaueensis]|uniref:Peptidase S9 prolyl oligopeptidase n=1 Tax=Gloeobacter kilaueensis (strain ATCC BAA-2537 / CCAP 1431/1 / ULC 316 / JS1) TaxID=1183438 RepID=U5QBR1_GLOK1|nr:S9 family peptidase [Gloeobacter kilaueensis]AGY56253.1 peptidase S9 prolyl oligopeptidase [Gloeobacter kilaueensis JS1]
MSSKQSLPFGSWSSPITAELIASATVGLGSVRADGTDVYWLEARPTEGGRSVLVRLGADGAITDMTPPPFNVRTRVHEYGGGAYTVHDRVVYFVHFADQRIYRLEPGGEPVAVSAEGLRYADLLVDAHRPVLIAVQEEHREAEVINSLVQLDPADGKVKVLAAGQDFYASPTLSPDGSRLAWLSWNHPDMPWDNTELWVADLEADGTPGKPVRVAGGQDESIFQPEWSPAGVLHFVSDRSNWWNLYAWQEGEIRALYPRAAEFGLPQWVFGLTTYAFVSATRLLCTYREEGLTHLALLDTESGSMGPIELPYSEISGPVIVPGGAILTVASAREATRILRLDLDSSDQQVLRRASELEIDSGYLSVPESVSFRTTGGAVAHAFFYPPANRDFEGLPGERPPLLIKSHGGPTAATTSALNLKIQYWTSRGFAVLDVNYRGSTGYGRAYRQALNGLWGIVDVDDCAQGALGLVEQGRADPERLAIDGGSAGGYTTLCALTFRTVFRAGASYYGVSDLASLAADTHKFESRYLDRLVGPYPERADLYRERSPLYHTELLACPAIFLQGLEDKVVPPDQAERMVEALRRRELPVAYLAFDGEQHGFRRAENIRRALEAEFYFFARIFGFQPADAIEPVTIDNLPP